LQIPWESAVKSAELPEHFDKEKEAKAKFFSQRNNKKLCSEYNAISSNQVRDAIGKLHPCFLSFSVMIDR
jgi:hypothetical protein